MLFSRSLASSVTGDASYSISRIDNGFKAYAYLVDRYEPITSLRLSELMFRMSWGIRYKDNADDLIREIRELNEHIEPSGGSSSMNMCPLYAS